MSALDEICEGVKGENQRSFFYSSDY